MKEYKVVDMLVNDPKSIQVSMNTINELAKDHWTVISVNAWSQSGNRMWYTLERYVPEST